MEGSAVVAHYLVPVVEGHYCQFLVGYWEAHYQMEGLDQAHRCLDHSVDSHQVLDLPLRVTGSWWDQALSCSYDRSAFSIIVLSVRVLERVVRSRVRYSGLTDLQEVVGTIAGILDHPVWPLWRQRS